jgi:hypothetical protein
MKRHVASTSGLTTVRSSPWRLGDLAPVVDAGTAERVGADADAGLADRGQVQRVGQVVDVGAEEVVGADVRHARRTRQRDAA